jgi:hypothetical protein
MNFWTRLLITSLICLWVGLAINACQPRNQTDEKPPQSQARDSSKDRGDKSQELSGFYFGSSQSQSDEIAWLLKIDMNPREGSLYMPPEVLKLSIVKPDQSNNLSFRSNAGFGDAVYEFNGQINQTGIRGTMAQKYPNPASNNTFNVVLNRFDASPLGENRNFKINGMYSNVKYIEDSGDLIGKELIFISTSNGFVGILTSFEGVPTKPYALVDVKLIESNLQFSIRTNNGVENYNGKISNNRIAIKRIDVPNGQSEVLIKNKSLSEILKL